MMTDVVFMGIVMVAGGAAFCLFGGVVLLLAIKSAMRNFAKRSWPSVQGNVLSCRVEEHKWNKKGGGVDHSSFDVITVYDYVIGAKRFHSDQDEIQNGRGYSTREEADLQVAQFPSGCAIQVYYNPANPKESTLTRVFSCKPIFGLLFGLTFVVLGLSIIGSSMGQFQK